MAQFKANGTASTATYSPIIVNFSLKLVLCCFCNSAGQNNWGAEMLQSDRIWICVYTVKYVTETVHFCRITQAQTLATTAHDQRVRINMDEIWIGPCVKVSSVNSVTSIALHGRPCCDSITTRTWPSHSIFKRRRTVSLQTAAMV